jgi:hypothetical protein
MQLLKRAVILFRNVEHCGISSALGINSGNSGIGSNYLEGEGDMMITQFRNRTEFRELLGISSNSGITISNMIVSSLTHLVTTQFRSGIPELSETGIGRNSTEFHPIPARLNSRNSVQELDAIARVWGWG